MTEEWKAVVSQGKSDSAIQIAPEKSHRKMLSELRESEHAGKTKIPRRTSQGSELPCISPTLVDITSGAQQD